MRKFYGFFILIMIVAGFLPSWVYAAIPSEISIDKTGKVSAKNLRVVMISEPGKSTFFFARAEWDSVFVRMTILTGPNTDITKSRGEKSTVFDIKEGDIIDIEGTLPSGSDTLNIQASKIVDHSLLKERKEVSGTVTKIDAGVPSFSMKTVNGNMVTINTGSAVINKGVRTIGMGELKTGDKILSAKGLFDWNTYVMEGETVVVHQDKSVFKPKNWAGTLKSISGTILPATLTVTVNGTDYTVYLSEKSSVVNNAKKNIGLNRLAQGDAVRFYGTLREMNLSEIDAEIIRDMNF